MRRWRGTFLRTRRGESQETGNAYEKEEGEGGSYGGENATEDETKAMDVSIVVRVMFHGGRRVMGGFWGVVRLRLRLTRKAGGDCSEKKARRVGKM